MQVAIIRPGPIQGDTIHQMPRACVFRAATVNVHPMVRKGFVFLTLEDEMGLVNIIISPSVYERNRRIIRGETALVGEGALQKEQGTHDIIAKRFRALETDGTLKGIRARNFHDNG